MGIHVHNMMKARKRNPPPKDGGGHAGEPASSGMQKQSTACCVCENQEIPHTRQCSACGQPLPPSSLLQTSPPPKMASICQANQTELVPKSGCSVARIEPPPPYSVQSQCCRCQRPVCCICQYPVDRLPPPVNVCAFGPPPDRSCSFKKEQEEIRPQTSNTVGVCSRSNPYFTEMMKRNAFNYANAQKSFSFLMRKNQRLLKLLTEKSSSFSNIEDLPRPMDASVDASFAPVSAIKTHSHYLKRKEHEHLKILTAVCDAILADQISDNQLKKVTENLQRLDTFSRSETSKDASGQTEVVTPAEVADVEVQITEITFNNSKGLSVARIRKKELPDVHITTSNRTMIVDKHIHADKSLIPIRRSRKSSEQSTSYLSASHGKKQTIDLNLKRTISRFHPNYIDKGMDDSNVQMRKEMPKYINSDTSFMSSRESISDND